MSKKDLKFILLSFVLTFLAVVFIASPLRTVFHHETFEIVSALQRGAFWATLVTFGSFLGLLFRKSNT